MGKTEVQGDSTSVTYKHQETYISTRAGVFYILYRIFIMALYTRMSF